MNENGQLFFNGQPVGAYRTAQWWPYSYHRAVFLADVGRVVVPIGATPAYPLLPRGPLAPTAEVVAPGALWLTC